MSFVRLTRQIGGPIVVNTDHITMITPRAEGAVVEMLGGGREILDEDGADRLRLHLADIGRLVNVKTPTPLDPEQARRVNEMVENMKVGTLSLYPNYGSVSLDGGEGE